MAINIFIFKPLFEYGNITLRSAIFMNKSLTETPPLSYQPITVCIISKHADIIHSNKVLIKPLLLA